MYLSADYWLKQGKLKDISIHFYNTGAVLFGVKEYVPALMQYVEKYGTELHFNHQLAKVDGPAKKAWFKVVNDENAALIETMYLSADYWLKQGKLKDISIHFYNTGAVLFGVK
ncbi:hypothetical protein Q2T49_34260, partial [Pseudomonas aeruginosa]|nr:hypothetical protein [Pseudomonas aeruginosa]